MSEMRYPQWRNANDRDKYPFQVGVSLSNGNVFLPDNLFSDARLYPVGGGSNQYLSKVVKSNSEITFFVSDANTIDLASVTVDVNTITSDVLYLEDRFDRAAGVFVTSAQQLASLLGWADGTHEFESDESAFSAVVVTPMPHDGVRSLRVDDEEALTDDVWLVGGTGVTLHVDETDPAAPIVTVHATGERMFRKLICDNEYPNPCYLKTINHIPPDEFGNFDLILCNVDTDNTMIRIEPITHGLHLYTVGSRLNGIS